MKNEPDFQEAARWFIATVQNRKEEKDWAVVNIEAVIEEGVIKKITTTDRGSFIRRSE